jgi:hypothetical protein
MFPNINVYLLVSVFAMRGKVQRSELASGACRWNQSKMFTVRVVSPYS